MKGRTVDHVALWVCDPESAARFFTRHLGMHVIARSDAFVLVGSHARHGKLTLFAADGARRDPGALERIDLRVGDVDVALERLPRDLAVERLDDGTARFAGPEDIPLGLIAASDHAIDYDLGRVVLGVTEPAQACAEFLALGFDSRDGELHAGGIGLALEPRPAAPGRSPLLNHIALRVDAVDDHVAEARRRGVAIADIVDAENTRALFVYGPDAIKLELVEHKPTFALT